MLWFPSQRASTTPPPHPSQRPRKQLKLHVWCCKLHVVWGSISRRGLVEAEAHAGAGLWQV